MDELRLLRSLPICWQDCDQLWSIFIGIVVRDEACAEADDAIAEILLSLPRPLMPLLEFLYSEAKYSQSSLSACET